MRLSRERLLSEAASTGFRPEILEKVAFLLALLEGTNRHPFLQGRLALKGGTALNLFLFDVPRLSVDLDLNYVGIVDRETLLAERPKIEAALRAVCEREGLRVGRVASEHAGGSWPLGYGSALGGTGTLKIDLNFMYRVPLWPTVLLDARPVGTLRAEGVQVLDRHELAAGKLAALLSRRASRDLFDAHRLLTTQELDPERLRLAFVLYGAMNRKDWRTVDPGDLDRALHDLEASLLPMLRRSSEVSAREGGRLVVECREALSVVLPLHPEEIAFLDGLLDRGEIAPQFLTEDEALIERISVHPALLWKVENVRRHRGL